MVAAETVDQLIDELVWKKVCYRYSYLRDRRQLILIKNKLFSFSYLFSADPGEIFGRLKETLF